MFSLSIDSQNELLRIARASIECNLNEQFGNMVFACSTISDDELKVHAGAFVSVYVNGKLRGCLGQFESNLILSELVGSLAVSASKNDLRFRPIAKAEFDLLGIEISVLTPPWNIHSIHEIELGKHGIIVRKGNRSGTFLPQVAASTGWNLEEFLGYCSRDKAGLGWDGWKSADLFVYEAIVFSDFK